jgi:hypothetical protein
MVCKPRQILFEGSIQGEKGKVHVERWVEKKKTLGCGAKT